MLRLPSNQREYDDYWSGDPAFHQPDKNDEAAVKEHAEKVRRARQTGDWSSLLIEGETPTKFIMRPIKGHQWRWLIDESQRQDEHKMGGGLFMQLMFRCACVSVKNLGIPVNEKQVKHPDLGMIAPVDIPDTLDAIDSAIVTELADAAFARAQNLDPL
jgi:hypothetical protein